MILTKNQPRIWIGFSSKAVIQKKIVIKIKFTYIFFLPLLYVALN